MRRGSGRSRFHNWLLGHSDCHRRQKPVSPFRQRLDVVGIVGVVAQRLPQFADHAIQPNLEVNKGVGRLQFLLQLFARNYTAGV